jgi:hypothetical protein
MSAEYDDLRAREAADEAKRGQMTPEHAAALQAGNRKMIEQEWLAGGFEPMPNKDGTLSSPTTLRLVGGWPPQGAKKIGKKS